MTFQLNRRSFLKAFGGVAALAASAVAAKALGANKKLLLLAPTAVQYDPAAVALFARMTVQPTTARKTLINNLIVTLKVAGIWAKMDCFYIMAAADAQSARLNWVQNAFNLLAVNGPTFTADRGYAGDGASSYLNTQFTPSTAGGQFTLNSASVGAYSRTAGPGNNSVYLIGAMNTNVLPRTTGNLSQFRINDSGGGPTITDTSGLLSVSRSASTDRNSYRSGALLANEAAVSTSLATVPIYICGLNNSGSFFGGTTYQMAQAHLGGGLSTQQNATLYNAVQAYMTGVGAQV